VGENESEEKGKSNERKSLDTLLDYMGQTGFGYSDITAARRICTAVRRSLNS
jgi:hypothetical protein